MRKTCIIVGHGHAAAQLAPSLRQEGWEDDIVIVGDEPYIPYHRPPLSKALLAGEKDLKDILIRPQSAYDKFNIGFKLNKHVTHLNRQEKKLTLCHSETLEGETLEGETLAYDKLALCTGSRVRKITVPGVDLQGVHYLRNIQDVEAIKHNIKPGHKAVIIGGGYIGLETAAVLNKLGMHVTVIEMMERVLERVTAPEVSAFYTRIHREEGVAIATNLAVSALQGERHIERVVCQDGTTFDADLVIVGVGILPNIELAEQSGLKVDNGIWVDEFACTEDPDIVAAGDCTNHPNKLLGRRLRLESVANAVEQARSAAASVCGKKKAYASHPWFWSDQYDIKLQIAGLNQGYDKVIIRGDSNKDRNFVAWYLKADKLLAADCINRPKEFMLAKRILAKSLAIDPTELADDNIDLKLLTPQ